MNIILVEIVFLLNGNTYNQIIEESEHIVVCRLGIFCYQMLKKKSMSDCGDTPRK